MKKIVISLAGVLAATAFAPEAAAVPAFARQVGMACTACHAQHFPVLNSFGRAFKAGGYTMMGAQGKIEGDHLSIPDTLNSSVILKVRHQQTNRPANSGSKTDGPQGNASGDPTKDGQWQFPDEFALMFGGRVAETVGFLLEGNMISGGSLAAGFKMPVVFDMGAVKVSVIPFITDALSVQYGYEQSSGGVMRANRWSEHRRETSAIQYNADRGDENGSATGTALVVANDMGYVNVSKYAANFGGDSTWGSTYLRVAATPTVGDWAMVAGLGRMSGQSYSAAAGATVATEQTFADLQMQGEVAGMELGVYAQYAKAPMSKVAGQKNAYNGNTTAGRSDRKAMTIGADLSVMPHVLTVGAAYRKAENGSSAATANGDNAITLTAVYDLYQNVALHLNYSKYSGSNHTSATDVGHLRTLMLEAAW